MVTADVLADDEEYAEVIQDLHEECGKYGAIRAVHVPRPPNPKVLAASVFGTGTYGKVGLSICGMDNEAVAFQFAWCTLAILWLQAYQVRSRCSLFMDDHNVRMQSCLC